jgi:hypothetical protein
MKVHGPNLRRYGLSLGLTITCLATLALGDAAAKLEPLAIKLPRPRFEPTPKDMVAVNLDPKAPKFRPPFLAPKGITNVALHKTVTSSDSEPIIGDLEQVTDGDKEARDGSFVELANGPQWVQIDLGAPYEIWAIICWHRHDDARVYRDVIVQTADDPEFKTNKHTLFNNDQANDLHEGAGKDFEYVDTNEGKLVDGKQTKSRYVRLWSKGSTADGQNHYTEVEVYALPVNK